ncbi:RagB/SusD family nutrient uptake outer membrane protein [Runella sp. CRIBMP]|uniref:RagB/SusD family nutrient uptake outer membrane protein n=1 Tax=Runella sp. CRIBMP TaxID=2683261 RepID=UPI001411BC00|nr:RagB/SusD family nutrient uptake outer membrane protein [Runella sp. CRIBMP]NBB18019.1 RagB/SusD family nutrient uptake outer membrane protein [Runella sp. CRIBMP]
MKKTTSKLMYLCGLGALALTSCTDLVVKEKDSTIVQTTGGTTTTGNPTELLNALYNDLGVFNDQANLYSLGQHPSAEMIPPTRGVDWGDNGVWRTLHAHTWDATHAQVLNTWNTLNGRAYQCEQLLASNPSIVQAAEAKAIRAMYMYHVMDFFGQVPRRTVDQGVDALPSVLSRSEAFDFIVKDLTEALPNLPKLGPAAINARASKAMANALLARLHLNKAVYKSAKPEGPYNFDKADMDKVVQYCDAVKADGFDLDPDFFNPFTANVSKDKIFTDLQGSPRNRWMMTMHYDQGGFDAEKDGPWNGFATLAEFYDKFEANDERRFREVGFQKGYGGVHKGFLIGQQFRENRTPIVDSRSKKPLIFTRDVPLAGASTEKGIRVIKYHPADFGKYLIFRYADVHLMKTEALYRAGNTAEALKLLNELRTLRKASTATSINDDVMLRERGLELYWEGIARTDEIRFGKFNRKYQDVTNVEPYTVLFPIPALAIASNTNLKQNPGY